MQQNTFGKGLPVRHSQILNILRIMKITAILLTAFCLHAGANGFSQTVTITAKNAPLERIFSEIQQQTGYGFIYRWENMQNAKRVTIEVNKAPLKDVLELCFKGQPLTYNVVDGTVIVSLRAGGENEEERQQALIDVKGRVVNDNNEPVAGASIAVKGTSKLTTTNEKGEFFLTAIEAQSVLLVTHVSFEPYEINLNGRSEVAVQLKTNVSELTAVAINTGYQVLKPNEVTGSVSQPDKQMYNARVSTDVLSKLEGITSGLVFNRTNRGVPSISIRGRSTIFANTDPLIVVDNFPYDGDINNINPNDIERIDILKDAAAASIWGVRAGNGVIVITTKKGKFNQPLKVELNTNVTFGEKPDLYYDRGFLKSSDFIDVEIFLFGKGRYNADFTSATKTPISPLVEVLQKRKLNQISAVDSAIQVDALRGFDVRDELLKYFYRCSINQQYAINLSGGNNYIAYFFSAGFDKNAFSLAGNEGERITLNSSATFKPIRNLEVLVGVNYSQTATRINNTVSELSSGRPPYPYTRFTNDDNLPTPIVKDYREIYADTVGSGKLLNWRYFPLDELASKDNSSMLSDIRTTVNFKYQILGGLFAEAKYQYEKAVTEGEQLNSLESYSTRNLINKFTRINSDGTIRYNIPLGGILNTKWSDLNANAVRGHLSYYRGWIKGKISVIAGAEIREIKVNSESNVTYGYDPNTVSFSQVNFDSTYTVLPSGSSRVPNNKNFTRVVDRFRSYFANAAYTYIDRYTLSLSGRIDQSNLLGVETNQKSVPLWSVGAKWQLSKENFFHLRWLPNIQLRTTYGYNGNLNKTISAYVIARFMPGIMNPPPIATIQNAGNPELRWEKIGIVNFGIDFGFKNDVITGSIDYYLKKGVDIIGDAPVPSSTGFSNVRGNFSNISGKGYDISLIANLLNKQLKWTAAVLFSNTQDKVTKFTGTGAGVGTAFVLEGRPVSIVTSIPWAGLDPSNGDPRGILADTISKNYGALNAILLKDQIYNGPANPVYFGGLRNTFSWNGVSLSFNLSFKSGYYFKRNVLSYNSLFSEGVGHIDYNRRWQNKGDEALTDVPSLQYPLVSGRDLFYINSEAVVERGDHIRFQDISLSYAFGKSILQKLRMNRLEAYIYANNLGILWRANEFEIDPDYQLGYPSPRTISFGIRAGF